MQLPLSETSQRENELAEWWSRRAPVRFPGEALRSDHRFKTAASRESEIAQCGVEVGEPAQPLEVAPADWRLV